MATSNRNVANRGTGAMVTSKQMRRLVPILLSLVILTSGLCSGLCFAQTDHSCCHERNHCGHSAPAMQAHQTPAISQIAPVILTEPISVSICSFVASHTAVRLKPIDFSPSRRSSVPAPLRASAALSFIQEKDESGENKWGRFLFSAACWPVHWRPSTI